MSLLLSGDDGASKVNITAFNSTGTAPQYVCRAWVNFNGTGTVAIRESGNVSSITDNGTGSYTVNFTSSLPDTDYATVVTHANFGTGTVGQNGNGVRHFYDGGYLVGSVRFLCSDGLSYTDKDIVNVIIFR